MKSLIILCVSSFLFCLPLQTLSSTWRDSELMKVVNQKLSTPSSPKEASPSKEVQSSRQSLSQSSSSSPKSRKKKSLHNVLELSKPMSSEEGAPKLSKIKSEPIEHDEMSHDHSKKSKPPRSEKQSKALSDALMGKRRLTETQRLQASLRMKKLWEDGGIRRVAFENKRDQSILQRLKAEGTQDKSVQQKQISHSQPSINVQNKRRKIKNEPKESDLNPKPKQKSKPGIKIEPKED